MQHQFLIWVAPYSDKHSDNLDYLILLLHFNVRSIKSRFVQYDLMFLCHIHHAKLDSAVLLSTFGLSVPSRRTRYSVLWHVPRGRVNTVQRILFVRVPSDYTSFLNCDSNVYIFMCTACSYKSRAISFSKTLDIYM